MAEEIEYAVVESTKRPDGGWVESTTEYFKSRPVAKKRQLAIIKRYAEKGVIGHKLSFNESTFGFGHYVGVMFANDCETFPQHTIVTICVYEKPTRSYP